MQNSYKKIKPKMKQQLVVCFLVFFSIIIHTNATMSVVVNSSLNLPAHVYKITCAANTQVTGKVSWNDNSDLDVYIYYQGTDFLNRNLCLQSFLGGQSMYEYITFTTTLSGDYYVQVYPYSIRSNIWLSYTINLTVASPSSSITRSANFYKNTLYKNVNTIILSNSQLPTSATYLVNTTVPNLKLTLYGSSLSYSYTPVANKQFCLPGLSSNAQWIIILNPNISSATTLTPIDFTLSWDTQQIACGCQLGFIFDYITTLQCQIDPNYNTSNNTSNSTTNNTTNNATSNSTLDNSTTNSTTNNSTTNNTINNNTTNNTTTNNTINDTVSDTKEQSIEFTKSNSLLWVIGAAIGTIALLVITITAIYCYRRHYALNSNKQIKNNNKILNGVDQQPSLQNIDPEHFSSMCPICLDGGCNATLPCKHIFHKICIQAWFKRNRQCPLCRNQFSKSKINEYH